MSESRPTHKHSDDDGHFRRKPSQFRNFISKDPASDFAAEANRYALYMNYGCPWAHRTVVVRSLKGLDDIVQMIATDFDLTKDGWMFTGKNGSAEKDPLYGFTCLKQLYEKADPSYEGRYLVPCLWDKKKETVVNNESSEIIRMFYTEFDDLLPESLRENSRPSGGFYPLHLKDEIDAMNEWVYDTINNGVYKCGFASTQAAYEANVYPLFESLDRLEAHLGPGNPANYGGPYIFGKFITEADVRLFTTLIRFDAAYHTIFLCNLKSIRHDYPNLYKWLRLCYWKGGAQFSTPDKDRTSVFKDTSNFYAYRYGYTKAKGRMQHKGDESATLIVPAGPAIDIDPLDDHIEEDAKDAGAFADKIERVKTGEGKRDAVAAIFAANEDIPGVSDGTASAAGAITSVSVPTSAVTPSNGDQVDFEPAKIERSSTMPHTDENEKWYKAAKKAEKKSGKPNVHLAL